MCISVKYAQVLKMAEHLPEEAVRRSGPAPSTCLFDVEPSELFSLGSGKRLEQVGGG